MKTTLTRETPSKVRMAVEASADEVAPAIDRAVRKLAQQVKIPGFRKGHVPRKVLEARIGRDAIREAALQEAIPELLGKAVQDETLSPISPPSVDVTSYELDASLAFDATVEVRPEIELPTFELLSATRATTAATEEEIEDQLRRMQDRFASLEAVERPVRAGDFALIDVRATLHDEEIPELTGTDQLYELASGFPIEELDRELEGARAGDIVKFNATIPEAIGGPHQGQEVTFQILVKEVRQKIVPDLDDDFAKNASEFETLEDLRRDLAERIEKVKAVQADADVRNQVLEQILDDIEVEAPETLVNEEMSFRVQRLEQQLRGAGMTLEQYMETQGLSDDQLEHELRQQAERNVRAQLILEEIGRREGFTVTEEELREEVRYHAESLRTDPETLAKQLNEGGRLLALAGDIIRRKALNYLVEKADVKEEGATGDAATAGSEGE